MKIYYWASFVFVGVVLLLGVAKQQNSAPTSLKVIEHATTNATTDIGAPGDSVGDILTYANDVYDETNTHKVGTDNGYCFRTVAGSTWECAWTLILGDGQITVEGPFLDHGDSVNAITGGTGAYMNARGQMNLHARNAAGSEYDFDYEIVN